MKKAQVTPFIIIGLVIVIVVGLLVIYGDSLDFGIIEGIPDITIPEEVEGINDLVDECLNLVSLEALNILGSQGGYINVPQEGAISPVDPFSNRLIFSNFQIPYWFYLSDNNLKKTQVPTKNFMKSELEHYINVNLEGCIGNFTQFREQGYDINSQKREVFVGINKNDAFVEVNWPLDINYRERNFKLDKFTNTVDAPLGDLYDSAIEIFNSEDSDFFLEERTIDILAVHDKIPYSETNFQCGIQIWTRSNVENELRQALSQNIPAIKIKGTNYGDVDKYFEWDALDRRRNIDTNLMYLQSWPLEMDVFPIEGEVLRSDQVIGNDDVTKLLGSFFCINNYNFVYDIKYPVLFVIGKDNYLFQFSTMVVVDNNLPRENLGLRNFGNTDSKICGAKVSPVTISTTGLDMQGNPFPLKDVSVSYQCSTTVCDIGDTIVNGQNAVLMADFPACINGIVIGEKEGYHHGKEILSSNRERTATLTLEPLYELDYDIKLIRKLTRVERDPDKEQVVFNFVNEEKDYRTSVVWNKENRKVNLIPGKYTVESFVMDDSGFNVVIEEKIISRCVDVPKPILGLLFGVTTTKCVEEEIPKTEIEQVLVGGATFDFEISREDLIENNKIVLYTLLDNKPSSFKDIEEVYSSLERKELGAAFKFPEFEK